MQLYSIASGSSGNCIYAGEKDKGILIDVGISMKKISEGLRDQNLSFEQIQAIFITHEHTDHISGLGPILRKVPIPVYATAGTIHAIWEKGNMSNISPALFHSIRPQEEVEVNDMLIRAFSISHDAAEPVCYTLEKEKQKIGIATDMGCYSDETIRNLEDCSSLLLEANHDINLLQVGKYPYSLKMRILGDKGHLSNDSCARLIKELLHPGLQHIMLGHLSKENNFPELAYQTVSYELEQSETWNRLSTRLLVANRFEPTEMLIIK
ncbi:MAG: MBL fold metallo-hydrolase [Lachnospiraceae bacterium]|nr:MBL fold metallo-hydrolase [Lachnospiraceae bacterium]